MRFLLTLIAFVLLTGTGTAQIRHLNTDSDTTIKLLRLPELVYRCPAGTAPECVYLRKAADADTTWCNMPALDSFNFDSFNLVGFTYRTTDCLGYIGQCLRTDHDDRTVTLQIDIYWGRCRAGGHSYIAWACIPKTPDGYRFTCVSVIVN